jgi:acetolactate synthase-1/2/3 large subunit
VTSPAAPAPEPGAPLDGAGLDSAGLDGGEALLQAARDIKADYIFTSSGSEWAPVWEALARADEAGTPGPAYVDTAHETVAVGMATGYAAVTGRGQVVLLHAGAGLLQGANAIHGALLTNAPMVVLSGESTTYGDTDGPDPGGQWYRNLSMVGGPQSFAAPFTKWSNGAFDASVVYDMVKRASEIAATAPAGPVYVNTPVEVLLSQWRPVAGSARRVAPAGTAVASDADIRTPVAILSTARNPVIAVESAGRDADAFRALTELAELLAIPVVEPQSAVCANFPRTHPLHAGGDLGTLAADADVVLLVGARAPWYPPRDKPGDATVIAIDDAPHREYMAYQVLTADHYVTGDIARSLRAITAALTPSPTGQTGYVAFDAELVRQRRERLEAAFTESEKARVAAEVKALGSAGGPVDPVAVAAALRDLLPGDAAIIDETITHSRTITRHLQASAPGRYRYVQGGLGQGIGVALGAKLALGPDRLTVLTVGDGSWLYNPVPAGLMAAKEQGLPLLVVVFNNGKYASMRGNHVREYPEGVAVRTRNFRGVDLSAQPDAAAVAAAAGALGLTVSTAKELVPALEEAITAVRGGQTAVVNVHLTR